MLNLYKYVNGANKIPSGRISYFSKSLVFDNPVSLVGSAGKGFDNSPIHTLYLANDSVDIDFSEIQLFTQDQDTSDGDNEYTWIQYRVLIEYTNSASAAETKWSPWKTVLSTDTDAVGNITDSLGAIIAVSARTMSYYSEASPSEVRDILTLQVRFSVPVQTPSQLKDDLSISLRATTSPNSNDGRP